MRRPPRQANQPCRSLSCRLRTLDKHPQLQSLSRYPRATPNRVPPCGHKPPMLISRIRAKPSLIPVWRPWSLRGRDARRSPESSSWGFALRGTTPGRQRTLRWAEFSPGRDYGYRRHFCANGIGVFAVYLLNLPRMRFVRRHGGSLRSGGKSKIRPLVCARGRKVVASGPSALSAVPGAKRKHHRTQPLPFSLLTLTGPTRLVQAVLPAKMFMWRGTFV
jgi:hypothetical protein